MAHDATPSASLDAELPAHGQWVRKLARSLVLDEAGADDLAQEVQLAALRRSGSLRGGLAPWLAGVARNLARRGRRSATLRADVERVAAREEAEPGADELVARLEIQRRLVEEVSALEPALRRVIVRRYFDGWSAARIARESGEPAATVRWRLQRGLAELRTRLDQGERGIEWRLALLPVCVKVGPWAATSEALRLLAGPATIQGVLTMKATSMVLAAGALATAVGLGMWWNTGRDEPGRTPPDDGTPVRAAELARPDAPRAEPLRAPDAVREEVAPLVASASEPAAPVTPAPAVPLVSGRFVDEQLVPIAGARLSQRDDDARSVRSVSDGSFALAVAPTQWSTCTLVATADGYATRFLELTMPSGSALLGDVVLHPGGTVRGRVLGPDGAAFAGASISVTAPDLWGTLDDARVQGPSAQFALTAVSGDDGRFEVGGVAVGPMRVWAGAPDMRWAVSPPVEVAAHRTTDEVELRLEPARHDDRIRGIVLSPDDEPVANASVLCMERIGGGQTSFDLQTDSEGRFEIPAKPGHTYDIDAGDMQDLYTSVHVEGIRPGTQDLELRLGESRWMEVSVRDEHGTAHDAFKVTAIAAEEDDWLEQAHGEEHLGGRARLRIATVPFRVRVDARGYALAERGPFSPEEAPADVVVDLVPEPGLHGRVLAGGEPLAGARVSMHRSRRDERVDEQGYPALMHPRPDDKTQTDADGRFTLKLREDGGWVVRAEAEGYAPADVGPLELDPELGRDDVELVLGRGGALEGRVIVAPGRDPAGVIVALNRGDARPHTQRADAEGRFRFEGLTPGEWHLVRGKAEFNPKGGGTAFSIAKTPTVIPFNCTVREGETTHQDLDLSDFEPCALAGVLHVNGAPAAGWSVSAWPGASGAFVGELPSTATAGDGSFALVVEEAGPVRLSFSPPAELGSAGRIDVLTELRPGPNEWRDDLRLGRVTGRCLSWSAEESLLLFYRSDEDVRPSCWLPVQPDASGRFVLPFVPAGGGSIRRFASDNSWTTLAECTVDGGRETALDVP